MIQVSPTLTRISVGDAVTSTWQLIDSATGLAPNLTGYTAHILLSDQDGQQLADLEGTISGGSVSIAWSIDFTAAIGALDPGRRARLRLQFRFDKVATEANTDEDTPICFPEAYDVVVGGPYPCGFPFVPAPMQIKFLITGAGAPGVSGSYYLEGTDTFGAPVQEAGGIDTNFFTTASLVRTITLLTITFQAGSNAQVTPAQGPLRVTQTLREHSPPIPYLMLWVDPVLDPPYVAP